MGILGELTSFAIAKQIVCRNGAEAVTSGELLRVCWSGRKELIEAQNIYCFGSCLSGECKLAGLKRKLKPIIDRNIR